jgi:hypothetical protein
MGLLERIVQRSKQKQQNALRPAVQPSDSNALTGTGNGTGTSTSADADAGVVLEEGNSAEPSDQLDFLFIDADSKDSSLGLSAPPKSFITASALHTLFEGTHARTHHLSFSSSSSSFLSSALFHASPHLP